MHNCLFGKLEIKSAAIKYLDPEQKKENIQMKFMPNPANHFRFFGFVVAQLLVFASVPVLANPVFDAPEGPPYYSLPPNFANPWIEGQTIDSVVQQYEAANASNPDSLSASCWVPLVPPPSPSPYGGYVADGLGDITAMIFEGQERDAPCNQGNWWVGIGGTVFCPAGDLLVSSGDSPSGAVCVVFSQYEVSFLPSNVRIPLGTNVDSKNHHVVTEDVLALNLTKNDNPVPGVIVPLKSSRGNEDIISGEQGTDDSGNDVAFVSTRQQPGTSTISSASSTIETAAPAVISWLPATYEGKFLVTCYAVANEKHQTGGPMVTIPGLSGKYHEQFYQQTRIQGTGKVTNPPVPNMPYIHRDSTKKGKPYKYVTCPLTARGDCATAGETIAVDPTIIPMHRSPAVYAEVSISGVAGDRTSEDGGSWINGYHIDLFYGGTWSDYQACLQWGRNGPSKSPHTVTFENYVH